MCVQILLRVTLAPLLISATNPLYVFQTARRKPMVIIQMVFAQVNLEMNI